MPLRSHLVRPLASHAGAAALAAAVVLSAGVMAAAGRATQGGPALADPCARHGLVPLATMHGCAHVDVVQVPSRSRSGDSDIRDRVPLSCLAGDGNRIQAVYAYAGSRSRLAKARPAIDQALAVANGIVVRSAAQTAGWRALAVATERYGRGCRARVVSVRVGTAGLNDLDALAAQLAAQGLNRRDRKYVVFGDGTTAVCGLGSMFLDDQPDRSNQNNSGPSYALVGSGHGCWTGPTVAHEVVHMLGGVQPSAPDATAGGHCRDGAEVMCYDDHTAGSAQRHNCPGRNANRLDCRHEDYFSTRPRSGGYLARHWNTASSSFLLGGGPPAPQPLGAPGDVSATWSETTAWLSWSAASGPVTGYSLVLPDGTRVELGASQRSYTDTALPVGGVVSYQVQARAGGDVGPLVSISFNTSQPSPA